MNKQRSDFIVIGAGVIGLATARALLKGGARVTVLEQNRVGRGSASWAAGGILAPLEPGAIEPSLHPVLRRSIAMQANWCNELLGQTGIDPELECTDLDVLEPYELAPWSALAGIAGFEFQKNFFGANSEAYSNYLRLFRVNHVRPPRLLRALATSVRQLGGEIRELSAVHQIEAGGVQLVSERLQAHAVVLAAGAWSAKLLPGLELEPVRGQMLLLKAEPGALEAMKLRQGMYLLQRRDGSVVAGSTLEDVGFDDRCTEQGARLILEAVTDMVPWLGRCPVLHHWSGLRPRPIGHELHLGWADGRQDLYLCTGHHRLGITLAPATAEIAAGELLAS